MVHNLDSWTQSPFASPNRYGSRVSHLRLIPDNVIIVNAYRTRVPLTTDRQTDTTVKIRKVHLTFFLFLPIRPSGYIKWIDSSCVIQKQMHEYFFPKLFQGEPYSLSSDMRELLVFKKILHFILTFSLQNKFVTGRRTMMRMLCYRVAWF